MNVFRTHRNWSALYTLPERAPDEICEIVSDYEKPAEPNECVIFLNFNRRNHR